MSSRNKAARNSGNYSRANCPLIRDAQIIPRDIILGALGALTITGIPFVLAVLKQLGAW